MALEVGAFILSAFIYPFFTWAPWTLAYGLAEFIVLRAVVQLMPRRQILEEIKKQSIIQGKPLPAIQKEVQLDQMTGNDFLQVRWKNMGCEDVVFSMSTVKRPGVPSTNATVTDFGRAELNLCIFTPDDDYTQVVAQAHLHGPAQQKHLAVKENDFPSSNSLCGPVLLIRSRCSSKRAGSLDFMEYVLPSDDTVELGCKIGGRSFWRNLLFWQRSKKNAVASFSAASSPQHPAFRPAVRKHKSNRATKREVLGPIYSDGISGILPGQSSNQQVPCPIIIAPMSSKRDGSLCPYMPLNRSQRIPCGPLYLP